MTLSVPIPADLFGDKNSVRTFARRLARRLYRSKAPREVFSELEYVDWSEEPADFLIEEGSWISVVDPQSSYWRVCEIGRAMESEEPKLFDTCQTKRERIDRLDRILLSGMETLWFTLATLNGDWVSFWRNGWREPSELKPVAEKFLTKYLVHARSLQLLSSRFLSWASTGSYGPEGEYRWTYNVAGMVWFATDREVQLDISAYEGDLCAALEDAGFDVP